MARTVSAADMSRGTSSRRKSPTTWPSRLDTSSPTMTCVPRARDRAYRTASSAPSTQSWSVIAMTSRFATLAARSRTSAGVWRPSENVVCTWGSQRPMGAGPSYPRLAPSLDSQPAGPEGGVVEDDVPGPAGRLTDLQHPDRRRAQVGAAERQVRHRAPVQPGLHHAAGAADEQG